MLNLKMSYICLCLPFVASEKKAFDTCATQYWKIPMFNTIKKMHQKSQILKQ